MRVCAIIPVALSEPATVIERSIKCLSNLDCTDLHFEAYYVIDNGGKDCHALCQELPLNFHLVIRRNNHGRRAGAINDVLNSIGQADCIALFDVDSRPDADFLTVCVRALDATRDGILASGCRYVTNKVNTLTKIISVEYKFFCSIYHLFRWSKGFIQFNGLIGVSKSAFLRETSFDERCSCEDLDMSTQIFLAKKYAVLADTKVGEQAPTTVRDLYSQRVRWFRGALEGLRRYLGPICKAKIPTSVKVTWLGSLTIPFFSFLVAPFVLICYRAIREESESLTESVKILLGLVGHTCLMTLCGVVATGQLLVSRQSQWAEITRSEV